MLFSNYEVFRLACFVSLSLAMTQVKSDVPSSYFDKYQYTLRADWIPDNTCEALYNITLSTGERVSKDDDITSIYRVPTQTDFSDAYNQIDWLEHPISTASRQGQLAIDMGLRGETMKFFVCEIAGSEATWQNCAVGIVTEQTSIVQSNDYVLVLLEKLGNSECEDG
ncbi:hypothetical protein SLH49_12505 [Cognatiyoonia sp. IB215446]|uniref:hypothetical protein n=1 Tax=Cognatiyoonia sp. IB215446 TaxID=3097355 RepID=UPI002A1444CC|nr:hypothetical protein [Cognatiyoonia sp. IB215446]MDX8348801.1 hypothetical protein [Cognatiyoonia sp. IB215446]